VQSGGGGGVKTFLDTRDSDLESVSVTEAKMLVVLGWLYLV